nr:trypsin-like peptidase domain-containing protein [Anaerolineae bacterium]
MKRITIVVIVLVIAALACNTPGVAPDPKPIETGATSRPDVVPTTPDPETNTGPDRATPSTELSTDQIDQIAQAAVQIMAGRGVGGSFQPMWTGSGTLISPNGVILTNCHVACGAPTLLILMTTDADQAPEPSYIAEITYYDEELDLAILQITADENGNALSPSGLPYLEVGDSDDLRLGEKLYIFGYPGVGGETITFTTGSVSGFESATVGGTSQRVIIKTDAEIASGNSGGTAVDLLGRLVAVPTAVNPDVREGVTLGGLGILRPVNLMNIVYDNPGAPSTDQAGGLPPSDDPDRYEPNDTMNDAVGPLLSGDVLTAYISWVEDVDFYWLTTSTSAPIEVSLYNIPAGNDYDLYLLNTNGDIVGSSENESDYDEYIAYSPAGTGDYWVAVISYSGVSTSNTYTLSVNYDGGGSAGAGTGGITITGRAIDANTGRPISGGSFGILREGVACQTFFGGSSYDMSLVVAMDESNSAGYFELTGVPRGAVYSAFFVYGSDYICEDNWLDVPADAIDSDIGDIEMSFN